MVLIELTIRVCAHYFICFYAAPNEEPPKLNTLEDWLTYYKLEKYIKSFQDHGYEDIDFIGQDIIDEQDMKTLGIETDDQTKLKEALKSKGYIKGTDLGRLIYNVLFVKIRNLGNLFL